MIVGGKLRNLGKQYLLGLADGVRTRVNRRVHENGVSVVRRAMIQAGLAKDLDGVWRVDQLRQELQQVIALYPANFAGVDPEEPENRAITSF